MTVVLTPIDGSPQALRAVPWAARLAGSGGTVVLLRAIPPRPAYAEALLGLAAGQDAVRRIEDSWAATAQADLDEAALTVAGTGATVERLVAEGEPDEAIIEGAERQEADLIAMASHGRGAIGRAIFGSVADRVTRGATVPVLVLRATDEEDAADVSITRLVVPFDGSELAAHALPVATELARDLDLPVHVIRAVDPVTTIPVAPGVIGSAPSVSPEISDRIWQEAESEARTTVENAVTKLKQTGIAATGAVLNGSPFFAISDATRPGDLLILTSHGRSGVRRWLLGSVAEKLVREAPVPVILVPAPERGSRVSG